MVFSGGKRVKAEEAHGTRGGRGRGSERVTQKAMARQRLKEGEIEREKEREVRGVGSGWASERLFAKNAKS